MVNSLNLCYKEAECKMLWSFSLNTNQDKTLPSPFLGMFMVTSGGALKFLVLWVSVVTSQLQWQQITIRERVMGI